MTEKYRINLSNKESFDKLAKQNKSVAYFSDENNTPTYMGETVYPMFNKDLKFD